MPGQVPNGSFRESALGCGKGDCHYTTTAETSVAVLTLEVVSHIPAIAVLWVGGGGGQAVVMKRPQGGSQTMR